MNQKFRRRSEAEPSSGYKKYYFLSLFFLVFISFFAYKTVSWFRARSAAGEAAGKEIVNPVDDGQWKHLTAQLEKSAKQYPGNVGIYLKDLNQNRVWTYKPDKLFPSASLIKVPVMVSVFARAEEKKIDLNTELKLTSRDRRSGSGSLKWAREGTKLSILEIIYKMITESDNTATQMLLDYFGMDYFKDEFVKLGLNYTNISQEGMSISSGRIARENYTTPREMAYLLEKIYQKELINPQASEMMLDIMKRNKSRSRLRKGLPRGWEMGHKTGLLRTACHDVGVVFSPRGDYLIAVLTSKGPNYTVAKNFISKIAKITAAYYKYEPSFDTSDNKKNGDRKKEI